MTYFVETSGGLPRAMPSRRARSVSRIPAWCQDCQDFQDRGVWRRAQA